MGEILSHHPFSVYPELVVPKGTEGQRLTFCFLPSSAPKKNAALRQAQGRRVGGELRRDASAIEHDRDGGAVGGRFDRAVYTIAPIPPIANGLKCPRPRFGRDLIRHVRAAAPVVICLISPALGQPDGVDIRLIWPIGFLCNIMGVLWIIKR